jgi:hypothetical protein
VTFIFRVNLVMISMKKIVFYISYVLFVIPKI